MTTQSDENARAVAWQDQQIRRRKWQAINTRRTLRGDEAARRALIERINPPLRRTTDNG